MIVQQLIILFGLIIAGFLINKLGVMNAQSNALFSKLLVNVTIPAMIIHSAGTQSFEGGDRVKLVMIIAILYFLLFPVISILITKLLKGPATMALMLIYSNLGFMGIPICSSIYGEGSVFYVTIFMMVFNVSIFTQGIWLLSKDGKGTKKGFNIKSMLNPGIVSAIIALFIFFLGIPIQSNLDSLLSSIGGITTPLAMMVIGSTLAEVSLKEVFLDKKMYLLAVLKLLVLPLILLLILKPFVKDPLVLGLSVILTSLPTAGNVSMVCSEYGGDMELVSKGICISTILSLAAIPFWITILA